jgi:hypothetical protein
MDVIVGRFALADPGPIQRRPGADAPVGLGLKLGDGEKSELGQAQRRPPLESVLSQRCSSSPAAETPDPG